MRRFWGVFVVVPCVLAAACPSSAPRRLVSPKANQPGATELPAELLEAEGPEVALGRAEAAWLGNKPAVALGEVGKVLRTDPDHLEARVLMALIYARAGRGAEALATAWKRVERILVIKGKDRPFALQTTLLGAAEHYLHVQRGERATIFLEALWRRFPTSEAAVRGQFLVAREAYREGRWEHVGRACTELSRMRPHHPSNLRCRALAESARRLLVVGPKRPARGVPWRWVRPLPQGNALNAIWVGRKGHRVAVGAAGTILEGEPKTKRWRLVASPTRWALRGLAGVSIDGTYAVGDGGIVLRRGHAAWHVLRAPAATQADLFAAWSPAPDVLFAVGDGGVILRYRGGRFTRQQPTKVALRGIWGASSQEVFVVGDEATFLRFDGKRWRTASSDAYENLRAVWGSGHDHVLIVGDRRTLIHFDGVRAKESVQAVANYRAIWGVGRKKAWAVGTGGMIIRGGRHPLGEWRKEPSGTHAVLRGIFGRSARSVWAVGDGGTILARRGRRWRLEAGGSVEALVGIVVGAKGDGLALGLRGKILTRRRGAWRGAVLPQRGIYRDLWSDGKESVAVGHRGLVVFGDGKAYRQVSSGTSEDLLAVGRCGREVYTVGTRGTVVRFVGDKATREVVPTGQALRGIAGCRVPVAVGDRGTILMRRGGRWQREEIGELRDFHGVWTDPQEKTAVAVGQGGVIFRRRGRRWFHDKTPLAQTLVDVWGRSPRDVYAISSGGNVIHFDGKTWRLQRSPAACLTALAGNAREVVAVGCRGGILKISAP